MWNKMGPWYYLNINLHSDFKKSKIKKKKEPVQLYYGSLSKNTEQCIIVKFGLFLEDIIKRLRIC